MKLHNLKREKKEDVYSNVCIHLITFTLRRNTYTQSLVLNVTRLMTSQSFLMFEHPLNKVKNKKNWD